MTEQFDLLSAHATLDAARLAPVMAGNVLPYAVAAQEDRSAPRMRLLIPAQLRPSGCTAFSVSVRNLSLSGFACDAVTGMTPGTRCWIKLPGIVPQQASIVWNDGRRVGGSFETTLNQAVLEAMIARYRSVTSIDD